MLNVLLCLNAQVEQPQPSILEAGKIYYLFNSGSKGFLVGGNNWHTQASIDFNHAYKVVVDKYIDGTGEWDGETYYINDSVETQNRYARLFIANEGTVYVDQFDDGRTKDDDNLWTIKPIDGKYATYHIIPSLRNKTFNSQNLKLEVSNLAMTKMPIIQLSENALNKNAEWCFVDTLLAQTYFKKNKVEKHLEAEMRKTELTSGLGNDIVPTEQVVYMYCPDYDGFLIGENQHKSMASLSKSEANKVVLHKHLDENGRWDGESYLITDSVVDGNYAGAYRNIFIEKDGTIWVDQRANTSHLDNVWRIVPSPTQKNAYKIMPSIRNKHFTNKNLPRFCMGVIEEDYSHFPIVGLRKDTTYVFSDWYFLTPSQRDMLYLRQRKIQLEDLCSQVANAFPDIDISHANDICHNNSSELSEIECMIGEMRLLLLSNGKTDTETDFTHLIINNQFTEEAGYGWHTAYDITVGTITWKGGLDYTDVNKVAPNPCAEAYQSVYDFSQKIIGVPKGLFRIDLRAFSRTRVPDLAWLERDSSFIVPVVYGNNVELPLNNLVHTVFPDTIENNSFLTRNYLGNDGAWLTMDGHYILNNHRTASIVFERGMFEQSLYCVVDSGSISIGIREPIKRTGAWTAWDNFRITYLPESKENYVTAIKCHLIKAKDTEHLAKVKKVDVQALASVISKAENLIGGDDLMQLRDVFILLNKEIKDSRHRIATLEFGDAEKIYLSYNQLKEEEETEEEKMKSANRNDKRDSINKVIDTANSYYYMGILIQNHNNELAIKHFHKALDIFCSIPSSSNNNLETCANILSSIYQEKGQYDKAIDVWTNVANSRSVSRYSSDKVLVAKAYGNIGIIFLMKDKYHNAEDAYRKATDTLVNLYEEALQANSDYFINKYQQILVTYINKLSYCLAYQKKYEDALSTINRAIELQPEEANYYDTKGEILYLSGDKEGAKAMWEKVISLEPDFSDNNDSQLCKMLFGK